MPTHAAEPTAELRPGARLLGPPRLVTMDKMVAFESVVWDRGQNSHNDAAAAQRDGLAKPLASGQNQMAFLHELLESRFGDGWVYGGKISVRYIHPVYAGDVIIAHAAVSEIVTEGEAPRVRLEVWCENQNGEKTAAGTASAGMPSGRRSWLGIGEGAAA